MIPCPKCPRLNDDEALYCDQCRTAVSPKVSGETLPDPCPACGGAVREVPTTMAVCGDCGISLGEGGPDGTAGHAGGPAGAGGGAAGREEPGAGPSADAGEASACPVCGTENPARAAACAECRIAFGEGRRMLECPKCSERTDEEKCGCGAVLTLTKLLGYVDPSVKVVCTLCKQLYTIDRPTCSDCGSDTRPAEALKARASAGR